MVSLPKVLTGPGPGVFFGILAGLSTALLWILSLSPFDLAESAYIALIPVLVWCYTKPRGNLFWPVAVGTGWLVWLGILIWLRHVTWFGTIILALAIGLFFVVWLRAALWVLPRIEKRPLAFRLAAFLGLAGLWVVLEWIRTWFLWGFPWAPLALSQWQRPVILQVAAWTGAWGVSFLLVFFNLCVAQTLWHRATSRQRKLWVGWFSPELYFALGSLVVAIGFFFRSLPEPGSGRPLFSASVVQPYITPDLKWDTDAERENLLTLFNQTVFVGTLEADLILWPEAATPWPVAGNPEMRQLVEELSVNVGQPILMGNLAWRMSGSGEVEIWENGVFLVRPETGLEENYYVKRKLVPFGEYVPLRPVFGFIEKFVPVGGDFQPGDDPGIVRLQVGGDNPREVKIGSLICYEDIFPKLARDSVQAGAEVLFVTANNAWYGEEGGAYQHAAHSVLRAVENRRPVMRCGNGGWSGWIDSYGVIREVIVDESGSVYFRGGGSFDLFQFDRWQPKRSFYTQNGDWFVAVCAGLVLLGWFAAVAGPPSRERE